MVELHNGTPHCTGPGRACLWPPKRRGPLFAAWAAHSCPLVGGHKTCAHISGAIIHGFVVRYSALLRDNRPVDAPRYYICFDCSIAWRSRAFGPRQGGHPPVHPPGLARVVVFWRWLDFRMSAVFRQIRPARPLFVEAEQFSKLTRHCARRTPSIKSGKRERQAVDSRAWTSRLLRFSQTVVCGTFDMRGD